jgi:hypothetical protein
VLRRRRVPVWILVAPVITVTATALLTYGSVRFRHSGELSIVVLAAVALDALLPKPDRREPRSGARMIAGDGAVRSSR